MSNNGMECMKKGDKPNGTNGVKSIVGGPETTTKNHKLWDHDKHLYERDVTYTNICHEH